MLNAEKLLFSNYNSRNQNKLSPWFSTPMLQSCSLQPEHKHVSHARKSYDSTTLKIASSQHTVTVHTQFLSPRGEFYTEKLRLAGPLLAPRCAWIAALLNIIISLIRQNLFSPLQQHSIQRKTEKRLVVSDSRAPPQVFLKLLINKTVKKAGRCDSWIALFEVGNNNQPNGLWRQTWSTTRTRAAFFSRVTASVVRWPWPWSLWRRKRNRVFSRYWLTPDTTHRIC